MIAHVKFFISMIVLFATTRDTNLLNGASVIYLKT